MKLDRIKQLAMLKALASVYPRYTIQVVETEVGEDELANLWYLKEQGLVEGALEISLSQSFIFQGAKITAKGLDFLEDDGGVTAILGTVTVRLHADSIKALLIDSIDSSAVPAEKKSWLKKQLDVASNESIKKLINTLLDQGVKHAPDLMRLTEQVLKNTP